MPDEAQRKEGAAGEPETFWDSYYRMGRYQNPDGTMVPLYDQVVTEELCRTKRFDPFEEADKRNWKKGRA